MLKIVLADKMAEPMNEGEVIEFLNLPNLLRLAIIDSRDGSPLVHPVWYYYENDKFVICTERNGLKAISLRKNPNVYFLVDVNPNGGPPRGVRGKGRANIIENPKYVADVMLRNIKRYMGSTESDLAKDLLKTSESSCVVEITPSRYIATWKY
jgi:nitroimidazol reductase NimA-like FMN-containing flavoprotein (pyridoxamine 5'-phosphate oxidase superfamily)